MKVRRDTTKELVMANPTELFADAEAIRIQLGRLRQMHAENHRKLVKAELDSKPLPTLRLQAEELQKEIKQQQADGVLTSDFSGDWTKEQLAKANYPAAFKALAERLCLRHRVIQKQITEAVAAAEDYFG